MRQFLSAFAIAALLSVPTVGLAEDCKKTRVADINGFDSVLFFMAHGQVDLTQNPPGINNCFGGTCLDDYHFRVIMGYSPAEIAAIETLAKDFFETRFGIDVDAEVAAGRVAFSVWTSDPRLEYRNYGESGKKVPSAGWTVHDGGFSVAIIDPAGFTLGGELAGIHVPPGSQALFGNYSVEETDTQGQVVDNHIIYYRAGSFLSPNALFEGVAACELSEAGHDFPGGPEGFAIIAAKFYFPGPTSVKIALRNTLTFGPSSVAPGLGPDAVAGTGVCGN